MLSVNSQDYNKVFDKISHSHIIHGVEAELRFKFLKFDPNGNPQIDLLFRIIHRHLIDYCLKAQRQTYDKKEHIDLYRDALEFLRSYEKSGELGEIILWFLIENILEAPQILAKMNLKTNPNIEVNGSDGIHAKVIDNVLNIFFGEAKLYTKVSQALTDVFKSLTYFHENKMYSYEYTLVTTHFKYADVRSKKTIRDYIFNRLDENQVRIRHACLVGYDWEEYCKLHSEERQDFVKNFKDLYLNDTSNIAKIVQRKFDKFKYKEFHFDMFFIPFESVDKLREGFLATL